MTKKEIIAEINTNGNIRIGSSLTGMDKRTVVDWDGKVTKHLTFNGMVNHFCKINAIHVEPTKKELMYKIFLAKLKIFKADIKIFFLNVRLAILKYQIDHMTNSRTTKITNIFVTLVIFLLAWFMISVIEINSVNGINGTGIVSTFNRFNLLV